MSFASTDNKSGKAESPAINSLPIAVVKAAQAAVASGLGAHNVTVSGSAIPPGALLFASLGGSETLGELFTYTIKLKTPDNRSHRADVRPRPLLLRQGRKPAGG